LLVSKPLSHAEVRLTLRQLAGLGLPSAVLLPAALAAITELVGADHAGFFYCDLDGNITNMYAQRMLSPEQMSNYYSQHYDRQESSFKHAYLKRVAADSAISIYSLKPAEKQSDYYKAVLEPLGIAHFLYAIVRSGKTSVGQISAYRGPERSPFSWADQQALQDVLHYVERLVDPKSQSLPSESPAPVAETAMAVLSEDDTVLYADAHWDRLLRMARGGPISPQQAHHDLGQVPKFMQSILAVMRHSNAIQHTVKTEWGTFRFRLLALSGQAGKAQSILISRQADELVFVAQAAAQLKLPVQQREVVLYMTQGKTNQQIAKDMGISVNTVNYHVKALFTRLKIHDRGEVLPAIIKAVDA
jgi:DNA-binding CsgD family transcriptional regulator